LVNGKLPKVVTAFPDFSISGNGLDDLTTPYEDGGGSWGIDSNLGRFATHFREELLPFLLKTYRVSAEPGKTILLGGSMGGMMAINFALDEPKRFPNIGAFYPPLDLRYSCNGDRLAPYAPSCYQPLTSFDPARRMTNAPGLKGRLFTERMFLFPVMDSDRSPGPVWKEDLPMADRLRAASPVERLRDHPVDLRGVHIWFVVGDHDDFNINAHAPLFEPLAKKAGADLQPPDHIRPGGHDLDFFNAHVEEAIAWTAARLAATR
jgi:pimeloyl-ACP methyl ester carboxylesterase